MIKGVGCKEIRQEKLRREGRVRGLKDSVVDGEEKSFCNTDCFGVVRRLFKIEWRQ